MVLIHEKITALLEQRRLKKRDLARALGVSPQTATDICKGRSAITLPHLRNLVAFFELRADFWLDDERLLPEPTDRVGLGPAVAASPALGRLLDDRLLRAIRTFLDRHRSEFLAAFPDLPAEDRAFLGVGEAGAARIAPGRGERVLAQPGNDGLAGAGGG
jgi:transcriptional regulator with XRE-family HTH domain